MKVKNKVLLAVTTALLGCSTPVAAKDNPYVKQYCSGVSDIAALVMIQRQSGVPIKEVMKYDSEYNTKEDKEVAKLVEAIALDAYIVPLYNTEQYKRQAVVQFSNEVFVSCMKTVSTTKVY